MDKILSIIVPTYNMEKYLDKCLSSLIICDTTLLQQLEVLVVIDGATDRSSQIAHSHQDQYPDVFITIDKENGNYGSCVNRGLEIATGKYVKVLDADDSFDTTHFEDYLRFLNTVDVDMIITPYTTVDESGKEKSCEAYDVPTNILLTWEQLTPAFKKKSLQMHAVTYNRQNIINIHYRQTEGISYTDQEWIFTPLTTVNTAIAYPNAIYRYLYGREGQTTDADVFRRNIAHNEQCCRRIIKDYKTFTTFEPYKQEYLDYKFLVTLTAMYNWYLVRYTEFDITPLICFDDFVRDIDESYIVLLDKQTLKFTCYHYIQRWHRDRCKRIRICKIYYYYASVMNKIRKIYAN